jgi:outer membrane PBP1 activator LpoA protein
MITQRNHKGQFTKGHNGFKPKGAINRKTRQQQSRIEELLKLIDQHLEMDVLNLDGKERIKLWLNLEKSQIKNKSDQPDPAAGIQPENKITFEVVRSTNSQ